MRITNSLETNLTHDQLFTLFELLKKGKAIPLDLEFSLFKNALTGVEMRHLQKKRIPWLISHNVLYILLFGTGRFGKKINGNTLNFRGISTQEAYVCGRTIHAVFEMKTWTNEEKNLKKGKYLTTLASSIDKRVNVRNAEKIDDALLYINELFGRTTRKEQVDRLAGARKQGKSKSLTELTKEVVKEPEEVNVAEVLSQKYDVKELQETETEKDNLSVRDLLKATLKGIKDIKAFIGYKSSMTPEEACDYLKIDETALYRAIAFKELPFNEDNTISVIELDKYKKSLCK